MTTKPKAHNLGLDRNNKEGFAAAAAAAAAAATAGAAVRNTNTGTRNATQVNDACVRVCKL